MTCEVVGEIRREADVGKRTWIAPKWNPAWTNCARGKLVTHFQWHHSACSVQFSSFWFDNPGNVASPTDRRFSCRSWAPLVGGWWRHHHWIGTRLSYHKWHCSNLFFWKGKGQIPFFKAHHPSTEKPKALVGFEPRTEPELGTGDSHSTSTPPPPPVSI